MAACSAACSAPGTRSAPDAVFLEQFRRDRVHHRAGVQRLRGHVEFHRVEYFARRQPAQVSHHLMGHLHLHQRDADLAVPLVFGDVGAIAMSVTSRAEGSSPVLRVDQRETLVEVEVVDDERLTLMDVHRAGWAVAGARPASTVRGDRPDSLSTIAIWAPMPPRMSSALCGSDSAVTNHPCARRRIRPCAASSVRTSVAPKSATGVGQRQLQCRATATEVRARTGSWGR